MTQDEIIEMARQAGFSDWAVQTPDDLLAFAKLVAEKEREACAKICEKTKADVVTGSSVEAFNYATKHLAERIRERGEK